MAIYEISHIYDEKYFRIDRVILMVGANSYDNVLCESDFQYNISSKNKNYCELTAIYGLHRNTNDDYYGIEHYRRYFCGISGKPITVKECKYIVNQGKIILPVKCDMIPNNFLNYSMHHYEKDLEIVRDIIIEDYREYFDAFESVMFSTKLSCYNMWVCNAETFHSYCTWLFEILEKCEKKIEVSKDSAYQARVFGFLAERLLNVWVEKNINPNNIVYREVKQTNKNHEKRGKVFWRTIKANLSKYY